MEPQLELVRQLHCGEGGTIELLKRPEEGGYLVRHRLMGQPPDDVYRALQTVCDPHLPKIYDIARQNDALVIDEEYCDGIPLATMLEGGKRFSEQELLPIALALCDALTAIHQKGIVHRDVKPGNVLMLEDGTVKLIDFNAARIYDETQEKDTRNLGTVGYAAPEQYGYRQSDIRADIYGLGATLYELLTGELPDASAACTGRYQKILRRCLAFDPKSRYGSALVVKHAFLIREQRKKRILCVGILLACLVCLAAFGARSWMIQHPPQPEKLPSQTENPSSQVEKLPFPVLSSIPLTDEGFYSLMQDEAVAAAMRTAAGDQAQRLTDPDYIGQRLSTRYSGRSQLYFVTTQLAVFEFWQSGEVRIEYCFPYDVPRYEILVYTTNWEKPMSDHTLRWEEDLRRKQDSATEIIDRLKEIAGG